ncbi:MAG: hypothetical protein WCF85_00645 [Rhodospirillaceae bacterium]
MTYNSRIPATNDYLLSLGRSIYNFGYRRWGVVWKIAKYKPSFPSAAGGYASIVIVNTYLGVAQGAPLPDQTALMADARLFNLQFDDWQKITNANPATDSAGNQVLIYNGHLGYSIYETNDLTTLANGFQAGVPVTDIYLIELGRAIYNFAYLRWGVVWQIANCDPSFPNGAGDLSSEQIATAFTDMANKLPQDNPDRTKLIANAAAFQDERRTLLRLINGNPCTGPGGEQMLLYNGGLGYTLWTDDALDEAAQAFENSILAL